MPYEQRPGDGTLWKNDKKREGKKDPDRKGDALIHCPHCSTNFEVWLSGWIKGTADNPFLSMSIKAKEDPGAYQGARAPDPARRQHDMSKPRSMPPKPPKPPEDPDIDPDGPDRNW